MKQFTQLAGIFTLLFSAAIYAEDSKVFFIEPSNGDTVDQTFEVIFGISGMTLAPAGTYETGTGHHLSLIHI